VGSGLTARSRAGGVELVVIGEGDTIVLRRIDVPRMSELADIVGRARRAARRAGMRRSDVAAAIESVRAR
jgi:hypothetical protein